jgi:hypothetical protein
VAVVLTGDVHQWIDSADRAYAHETESALSLTYARVAGHHGLKVTLFFTGLAIVEDATSLRALLSEENVEIGGHGWDSFRPRWRYRATNNLFGSPHGTRAMQARAVRRTCATIEEHTGRAVLGWRNHAYLSDGNTPRVLADAGITVWSDEVDQGRAHPYRHPTGLTVLPINTTPDHEHLYHGAQTVDTVPENRRGLYHDAPRWLERVEEQVGAIAEAGGTASILAHPLCMKVTDDWQTFEHLCAHLSRYESAWATEAAQLVSGTSGARREPGVESRARLY